MEQRTARNAGTQFGSQQERARQLSVQGVDLLGWGIEAMGQHYGHQFVHSGGDVLNFQLICFIYFLFYLRREVVVARASQCLGNDGDGIAMGRLHHFGLVASQEANVPGPFQHLQTFN